MAKPKPGEIALYENFFKKKKKKFKVKNCNNI